LILGQELSVRKASNKLSRTLNHCDKSSQGFIAFLASKGSKVFYVVWLW